MELHGRTITLRSLEEHDLELMMKWRNANRECFFDSSLLKIDDQRRWFEVYAQKDDDYCFIIETEAGVPIGTISLYNINYDDRSGELGRLIVGNPQFLGKGYAHDACEALLNYSFNTLDLERIYLEVIDSNERAIALYKELGFSEETKIEKSLQNGFKVSAIVMSLHKIA